MVVHLCIFTGDLGSLDIIEEDKRSITVKCSPDIIPQVIEIYLSGKRIGQSIYISRDGREREWFKKGSRTQIKLKVGGENFYLYSAINPKNGENFNLFAPYLNTDPSTVAIIVASSLIRDSGPN